MDGTLDNDLMGLQRLIARLETEPLERKDALKGSILKAEFGKIIYAGKIAGRAEGGDRYIRHHLYEAERLAKRVIKLKLMMQRKKDLNEDEYYQLTKYKFLLKEFSNLLKFYTALMA